MDVVDELKAREPIFHRAEFGTTRADFARMIVDDYWEIGASGARYDRDFVLDTLEKRHATKHDDAWRVDNFAVRALDAANRVYLATYDLVQNEARGYGKQSADADANAAAAGEAPPSRARHTRRATIWRRDVDGWRALYHQGTIVAPG